MKPAIEQLDNNEQMDSYEINPKRHGVGNIPHFEAVAMLNSSRKMISTENEQMSYAIFTNTSRGKMFNLDDTIPDVSQTDPQSSDCPQAMSVANNTFQNQSNAKESSRNHKVYIPPILGRNISNHNSGIR